MGPGSSTLEPCLARRGASSTKAWLATGGKKGGDLGGALAPDAYGWARPLGAGVLLLKWFHLRFWDLTVESRGHLVFF